MNELENYLQQKVKDLKLRRENEGSEAASEDLLFQLILMETSSELSITLRDFPDIDANPITEKCIYIEARRRFSNPEDALLETKKQMEDRINK